MTSATDNRAWLLGHHHANMTFAGELSFLRRRYTQDLSGADVAILGIPFDSATTYRPGARLGPRAVREASAQLAEIAGRAFPFDIDLFNALAIADCGDCELDSGYPLNVVAAVESRAAEILATETRLISLGGDHFVTYPLLRAHAERYGPIALVHFDAHVDTWDDDGQRLDHGTMFARAVQEGLIDVSHSAQIGIRSFSERDWGFTVLDAPWVHQHGPDAVIKRVLEVVGDHPSVYLTFDIDCLDPSCAPGTGTPVAGGLNSAQALAIVRGLAPLNIVGMDLVEVAPAYDHAEITALAAANIVHDVLCGFAQRLQS